MAQYHTDEGLQNLFRTAPLMATWDDHEFTNNPHSLGTVETTGAQNHQAECAANRNSTDAEKNAARCSTDEGDIVERLNVAAEAYMEWMPIREYEGSLGVVEISNLQVIEWGDLATFVAVDSRVSQRSEDPTINSSFFSMYGAETASDL